MKIRKFKKIGLHSYIDYSLALLLMISSVIFNMRANAIESKIIFTVGLAVLLLNSITVHRLGLAKIVTKKAHLKIDLFLGWLLVVSPFLFGFFATSILPHLLFGCALLVNAFYINLSSKKVRIFE